MLRITLFQNLYLPVPPRSPSPASLFIYNTENLLTEVKTAAFVISSEPILVMRIEMRIDVASSSTYCITKE
ncbi:hypothetical protein BB561_002890 [Smittium simulii]|uniref:Uncharacterized protein n=1 Tax=Smittium simulii TaxID=133385 RepID=A0A2T9YNU7_9FUNG|nr:hypothetical protein BB561_002890 [Smittium simulii]